MSRDEFDELDNQDRDDESVQSSPLLTVRNLMGRVAAVLAEETGTYRGVVLAAMERALVAYRSRFHLQVGGRADADGVLSAAEQAADGFPQRALLDPSGAWWVHFIEALENWVSERNAIVGEDARAVPLQHLTVGKETTKPVYLARELEISLFNAQYSGLVTTLPFQVDRAKRIHFRVTYAPTVNGAFPRLYPQVSQGTVGEVWAPVMAKPATLSAFAGYANPPAYERKSLGYFAENLFETFAASLIAASEVTATLTIESDDTVYPPGCYALRFALQDSSLVTPGLITIVGTQE